MAPALFLRQLVPARPRDMEHNRPSEHTPLLKHPAHITITRPSYTFATGTPSNRRVVLYACLLFALLLGAFIPAYLYLFHSLPGCRARDGAIPAPPALLYSHAAEYSIQFSALHVTDASLNVSHFPGRRVRGRIVILPPPVQTVKNRYSYWTLTAFVRTSAMDPSAPRRVVAQIVTRERGIRWLDVRSHDTIPPDVNLSPLAPNTNVPADRYIYDREHAASCNAACLSTENTTSSIENIDPAGGIVSDEVYVDVYLRPGGNYDGPIHIHATILQVHMATCASGNLVRGKGEVEWVWTGSPDRQPPAAIMK
ncbi:hypothetical protein ABW21_db0208517 [Orbilia brochopaga]|nr:hypothetical protein ABW21_db0208517 [Drechslerella brochopaga]